MKQFLQCLIIVASVAWVAGLASNPVPRAKQPAQTTSKPKALAAVSQLAVAPRPKLKALPTPVTGCRAYLPLVQKYNWNVSVAMAIAQTESNCNPGATSPTNYDGSIDRGIMQINSIHADMVGGELSTLYSPAINIAVAYRIYAANGWRAWSSYTSGAYLKHL